MAYVIIASLLNVTDWLHKLLGPGILHGIQILWQEILCARGQSLNFDASLQNEFKQNLMD